MAVFERCLSVLANEFERQPLPGVTETPVPDRAQPGPSSPFPQSRPPVWPLKHNFPGVWFLLAHRSAGKIANEPKGPFL